MSLPPLTVTWEEAVVQTRTFPATGHPGFTVLSTFPCPLPPIVREVLLPRSPCRVLQTPLKANSSLSRLCTRHPARLGLAG